MAGAAGYLQLTSLVVYEMQEHDAFYDDFGTKAARERYRCLLGTFDRGLKEVVGGWRICV